MKTLLCAALIVLSCGFAVGQQYKVLYSFAGLQSGDGSQPLGDLVLDRSGNLYGTTLGGGNSVCSGCGTVFQLSPNADGSWTETVLYTFCSNVVNFQCLDGTFPRAGLVLDGAGNLYGTTSDGGNQACTIGSCGVVFQLSPPSVPGGSWAETVLYNFCSNEVNHQCLDGNNPQSQLARDAAGNSLCPSVRPG